MKNIALIVALAAAIVAAPASASIVPIAIGPVTTAQNISFSGLPAGNPNVTSYNEAGYTLTTISGTITGTSGVGNPAPAIFTRDPATFTLTNGGLFGLTSVDIGTSAFVSTLATYSVGGYLNNVLLFNDNFTTTTGGVSFDTHQFNAGALLFDRVSVSFSGANGYAADIDNFRLFTVANVAPGVPEPATWAMMTLGFGAMGFAMRRKKSSTRIRFA